jgi:GNAT superfamily N-acetyltransferase
VPYRIVRKEQPKQEDVLAIIAPLQQFNLENGPPPNFQAVVLAVEDDTGTIVGGLFGKIAYNWLFVEYLVTPPDARRQRLGSELMDHAEQLAREAGCLGVYLDTLYFQALPFYQKRGYTIFGELEQRGEGPQYWLKKRLDAAPEPSSRFTASE